MKKILISIGLLFLLNPIDVELIAFVPKLDVIITTVLLKSITLPKLSTILPSSRIWRSIL